LIWLLFGAPGSGKGTQSKLITQTFGFKHLSTGDMFRKHLKEETELGKKAKSFMNQGALVPDNLVIEMVSSELSSTETTVLDGFPRTLDQGKALADLAEERGIKTGGVIYLEVPESDLKVRLSGRRMCKNCGHLAHVQFSSSKVEGVCDKCGSEMEHRKDDQEDVIEHRLSVYNEQTRPLMSYYEGRGLLKRIDGTGKSTEVFEKIKEILK
jgi:adenylate kinase